MDPLLLETFTFNRYLPVAVGFQAAVNIFVSLEANVVVLKTL
jgi:hypothetical protein